MKKYWNKNKSNNSKTWTNILLINKEKMKPTKNNNMQEICECNRNQTEMVFKEKVLLLLQYQKVK
jgi:hypothetical protein